MWRNYKLVVRKKVESPLTPLSCEREPGSDKAEANDHIPSTYVRDWIESSRDVENDDPEKSD